MKLFNKIIIIYVVLYLTVIVHELFHFAFAKIFNIEIKQFVIGTGVNIIDINIKGINFVFNLLPIGGYNNINVTAEKFSDIKNQLLWILAGGAIGNTILGIISLLILFIMKPTSYIVRRFFVSLVIANLLTAVIIPFQSLDKDLFMKVLDGSIIKDLKQ